MNRHLGHSEKDPKLVTLIPNLDHLAEFVRDR